MVGIFAPQYYGSVRYYAAMAGCDRAIVDIGMRYDKRFKSVHRCDIVDAQGPLRLTVPVSKPALKERQPGQYMPLRWDQVVVSDHGQWWSDHLISLESAYGRTPYFEFYIDRLLPWLKMREMPITQFDAQIDTEVRSMLHLPTPVEYLDLSASGPVPEARDFRNNQFPDIQDVPYYQVRMQRLGFVPNLCILDLLFNLGPEAQIVLAQMARGEK
ncbi:MAG: WbqC family protein [Bacteroidales bacterium]|nr:WbqC family protein [Bacteroidales bacterium]